MEKMRLFISVTVGPVLRRVMTGPEKTGLEVAMICPPEKCCVAAVAAVAAMVRRSARSLASPPLAAAFPTILRR